MLDAVLSDTSPVGADAVAAVAEQHGQEGDFWLPPLVDVQVTEEEIRRCSSREDIVVPLRICLPGEERGRHVLLQVHRPGAGTGRAKTAELLNFSPEGARILTHAHFAMEQTVILQGVSESSEELFAVPFIVVNVDKSPQLRGKMAERCKRMGGMPHAYGLLLQEGAENLLYKAALDSVYLATVESL